VLEASGRFTADVTEHPETMTPELLARYDLVLGNWTNYPDRTRSWGPAAEKALFDFVRGGKGYALFHAAAATFPDWPEFGRFDGAGWVPRIPGRANYGSGHGARHTFKVEISNHDHPITRGLQDFYHNDELWHRLNLQPGAVVLGQAYSRKEVKGTEKYEPMIIAHEEGRGRVFFLVPGHDVTAMSSPAWRTLMLRGAEWAATGQVTLAPLAPWPAKPEMAVAPAKSKLKKTAAKPAAK
jgi:type 1 glutamine amidotransferase